MSIDVMTKVLQRCTLTGSQRLALLVMGNWCDDEGESLYPSIELIAEAMQVSRSQAQRVLHSLMPTGEDDAEIVVSVARGDYWLRVIGNEDGGAPGTTRRYQLNVARLDALPKLPAFEKADERRRQRAETGRTGATPNASETGRMDATPSTGDGSHGCDPTGRTDATRLVRTTLDKQSERERAREESEETHQFEKARKAWPTGFADSREDALTAWAALSEEDRCEALAEIGRYVSTTKSAGRSFFGKFADYLAERKWQALPEHPKPISRPTAGTSPAPVSSKPTSFQRANPHLYPELFGGNGRASEAQP